MANSWLRLWHEMPNDPKWRTISRASKQPIPSVMAVYLHLLVNASNATERGRTQNVCNEDIASALDIECEQVDQIIDAMQGRVLDGDLVNGWKKRQVEREDGAAERSKAWREEQKAKKAAENAEIEQKTNATERNRTQEERKQTPDKDKDTDTELKSNASEKTADSCPVSEIIALYNTALPMLANVKIVTDTRKRLLKARWSEDKKRQTIEWWERFFKYVSTIPFLMGENDRGWQADFDYMITLKGFVKILEGGHEGKKI